MNTLTKKDLRARVYRRALLIGEDLMPCHVANIIFHECGYKNTLSPINRAILIKDIHTSCGFELTLEEALEV